MLVTEKRPQVSADWAVSLLITGGRKANPPTPMTAFICGDRFKRSPNARCVQRSEVRGNAGSGIRCGINLARCQIQMGKSLIFISIHVLLKIRKSLNVASRDASYIQANCSRYEGWAIN